MVFLVDQQGYLIEPKLHDGFVDGIRLEGEGRVTVLLRTLGGERLIMDLIGVEAFACDDFREGNIILDVQIVSGIAPNENSLDRLYGVPHNAAEQAHHDRHQLFLAHKIERIAKGLLSLVAISPSYGCALSAVCQEVSIAPFE